MELLEELLKLCVTIILPVETKILYEYARQKINNSRHQQALDAVYAAVSYIQQTYVDEMKGQNMFDKQAQKNAFYNAKDKAFELMTDGAKKYLEEQFTYDGIDAWVEAYIEKAVAEKKD